MIHRTKKLTFRVTEKELYSIKQKVHEAGISQQKFLLNAALGKEIRHLKEYQSLMVQIKKIGVNINQIARHCNETGILTESEMHEIRKGMEQIWRLLNLSKIHVQE